MNARKKVSAAEIRYAFVNNVQLLGFPDTSDKDDPTATNSTNTTKSTKSRRNRIPFGPKMFAEVNQHGFNAIIYFLLIRLNPEHYKQHFDTCWPVYDSNQQRAFRKLVLVELRSFENLSQIPRGLAQASLLANPKGARADRLMWHLSSYVLREVVARDHGSTYSAALNMLPKASGELTNLSVPAQKIQLRGLIRATEAQATYREQMFREQLAAAAATQSCMIKKAESLTSDLRALESHKAVLTERVKVIDSNYNQGIQLDDTINPSSSIARVEELVRGWDETAQNLNQEVRDGWEKLEPMLTMDNKNSLGLNENETVLMARARKIDWMNSNPKKEGETDTEYVKRMEKALK